MCEISTNEFERRAKLVMNKLFRAGELAHNDLGHYFLNANAVRCHLKSLLRRNDARDCLSRLEVMYPLLSRAEIPKMEIASVPKEFKEMLVGAYKIEWHYDSQLNVLQSDEYKKKYKTKMGKAGTMIYPKCKDTMGFDPYPTSIKMWLETLYRPGQLVTFTGSAYHMDSALIKCQTAKMVSIVFDYDHFMTVTQVY